MDVIVSPLFSIPVLAGLGVVLLLALVALFVLHRRMLVFRTVLFALFFLALLNPVIKIENRDRLPTIVVVLVDRSDSQGLETRSEQSAAALAHIKQQLKDVPDLDLRVSELTDQHDETRMVGHLQTLLQDIAPQQLGAVFLISDGQVHDVPRSGLADLSKTAPVHALITGRRGEIDRRLTLLSQPRFGIIGQEQTIRYRIDDLGKASQALSAQVTLLKDGKALRKRTVLLGEEHSFSLPIDHGGANLFELRVAGIPQELTNLNNRAFLSIEGIRETLRVLLISGEPYQGERVWRRLLKSDPAVDLVHFTILRPPFKQDGTPINQLALIAFPTQELFHEKINEFDLIIFDRYKRRSILNLLYFDNIARYVERGGALLVASGAEYAGPQSVFQSPLSGILPALPQGNVLRKAFLPKRTEKGLRHPVTRDLPSLGTPPWSQWYTQSGATIRSGETLMTGADKQPLLILARVGEGRVAQLLSDHVWLWARGHQGGGPYVPFMRRIAHWLMKEPALEEEKLQLVSQGQVLQIIRQSMRDKPGPVQVKTPKGTTLERTLERQAAGQWQAELPIDQTGLYTATADKLAASLLVGKPDSKEWRDVISTTDHLARLTKATHGATRRLVDAAGKPAYPRLTMLSGARVFSGPSWLGIARSEASALNGVRHVPLFHGLLGLALLVGITGLIWWRESR